MEDILAGNTSPTGDTAAFLLEIPANEKVTYQFSVGFYNAGTTISGPDIKTSYIIRIFREY